MALLTISIEDHASGIESLMGDEARVLGIPLDERRFCAVLRNPQGGIEGGINARCSWDWLQILAIVVASPWRGQGYGQRLLERAEAWGVECACHNAWLMTMGADAQRFYERAGYREFGTLPHYPGEHTRVFMRKAIG